MFSGWVNRHQLDVIEYLLEENRVLKETGAVDGGSLVPPAPVAVESIPGLRLSGAQYLAEVVDFMMSQ
jgi:hypothetical protein